MTETFCGKHCAECTHKEELACPGCKPGPGRQFGGDCKLAKCAGSKGHETCESCIFKGNCSTLRGRDSVPDYRIKTLQAENRRKAAIAKRAPVLGKWLWVMFWLIVPGIIAGFLTNEDLIAKDSILLAIGHILNAIVSVLSGYAMLKMAEEEDHYRTAGICSLAAAAFNMILAVLPNLGSVVLLFLSLPIAAIALFGEYHEYKAHASVLIDVDHSLSEKWDALWKWYVGLLAMMIGSLLIMLLIPILGALMILGTATGVIVVSILKLLFLYRTAKIFRGYPVAKNYGEVFP